MAPSEKQSNQKDISQKERLELALDATNLGIWDYNPKTGGLVWDQRCRSMFGLPDGVEESYELFLQMLTESSRAEVKENVRKALKRENGGTYSIKYRIKGYSGELDKWIKSTGKAYYNEKNEAVRLIGTIQDITDIITSNEQYLDVKERLNTKTDVLQKINEIGKIISAELDHKKIVQLITNLATEITGAEFGAFFYNDINEAGEKYMLFTHSGLGKEKFDTYPMPRNTKIFSPTFKGEKIVRYYDVTAEKNFGQNAPYFGMPEGHPPVKSYLAVPVFAKNGEVLGGLFFGHSKAGMFNSDSEESIEGIAAQAAIAIENARLYEAEQAARKEVEKQREFMYRIFEDAPALIIVTKGPKHKYEFINKKAREIFGNRLKLNHSYRQLNFTPKQIEMIKFVDNVYRTGEPAVIPEMVIDMKDFGKSEESEIRYFNAFYFPIKNNKNETEGIIRYGWEITEQVKSRKSTEEFMSIASHELKTPITVIMSYLELLKDNISETDAEEKTYISRLDKGVNRLNKLVNDLLDVTRIHKGRLNLDLEPIHTDSFVKEFFEGIYHLAEKREILILGDTNKEIYGDPGRLEQVLLNLFVNALKYSDGKIEIILSSTDDKALITIKDYGIGIPNDKLPMLFKQFSMIDQKKTTGLGIGLYIAKEIITKHNGEIEVKSTPGQGSEFTIVLPVFKKG